jgi:hypothetical protein
VSRGERGVPDALPGKRHAGAHQLAGQAERRA